MQKNINYIGLNFIGSDVFGTNPTIQWVFLDLPLLELELNYYYSQRLYRLRAYSLPDHRRHVRRRRIVWRAPPVTTTTTKTWNNLKTASEVFCKLIQVHDHVIVISERKRPQFFFVSAACSSKMKRYNIAEVTIWALAALATLHSTNCLGKSFYLLHFLIKKKSSFLLFVDFRKTIRPLFPQISKCQMIS